MLITFTDLEKAKTGAAKLASKGKDIYHVIKANLLVAGQGLDDTHFCICSEKNAKELKITQFEYSTDKVAN